MNIRQQIINNLIDRMEAITGVNAVYDWHVQELAPAESPVINVKDLDDDMSDEGVIGKVDHDLNVDLEAQFFGKVSNAEAREMLLSMATAVGTDPKFGSLAYASSMKKAAVDPEETGELNTTATLSIVINYRSDLWTL
jgi:hypothetical protein